MFYAHSDVTALHVSALVCVPLTVLLMDLPPLCPRSDITALCIGNAYNRLQWEDVTVSGRGGGGKG